MYILLMIFFIMSLISLSLYLINFLLSMKKKNREKLYPLECGFNMMNSLKLPFSIQFFYIAIMFLIFDIEITLILPMIQKLNFNLLNYWMMSFYLIIIILLIGLFYEWKMIKWN